MNVPRVTMESGEIDGEFYLDDLSDCPDDYSGGESEDESDDCDTNTRKQSPALSLCCSDSDEDEVRSVGDDADEDNEEAWSTKDETVTLEPYKGNPGIKTMPGGSESVLDCANLFMGNDFFEHLVNETNRYHSQVAGTYRSRLQEEDWTDITVSEMKKFMGLILLMGQIKKSVIGEYWSDDLFLRTPYFSEVMTKDRFMQIMKYWHFCNNETIPLNSQRLVKIQPFTDSLQQKFIRAYTPRRHLTLEECIIPWRGQLSIRARDPSKITKKGILVRMLCEAVTGYICNFQLYDTNENKLEDTVLSIIEPYKNIWHHIYQDNYYNSVEIAQILLKNKVRMCGIIRKNRDLPKSLRSLRLTKGMYEFRRNHQVLIEVWHNGRQNVKMISTIHSARMTDSRRKQRRSDAFMQKPKSIVYYEKYTKGIDRSEYHLDYYSIFRKTKKWTKRVLIFFINCALFNSFKVFTAVNKKKYVTYKRFLHKVAISWTQDSECSDVALNPRRIEKEVSRNNENPTTEPPSVTPERFKCFDKHEVCKMPSKSGSGMPLLRQCRMCAVHKKRSRTTSFCRSCRVPLHNGDCFEKYHISEKL